MSINLNQYELDPCRQDLSRRVHAALTALLPESASLTLTANDIGHLLEEPPEGRLGDYALPCFRFAKDLRRKPPDIATALAQALSPGGWLAEATAVGAFLNLFIAKNCLARAVIPATLSGAAFCQLAANPSNSSQRVMIEFSQPNTHKELHVGHGRNVCLGSSLVRLFRYCGYQVTAANYFGDEGTHIATELSYIRRHQKTPPAARRSEWFSQMYVEAKRELASADEPTQAKLNADISAVHRQIESKTGEVYEFWLKTRQWSLDEFEEIYRWLDVKFDVAFYESEVSEAAQGIVDEYVAKGIFIQDDGAIGVDLKPYKLGFSILRKRDGNTLYATKDLALARLKFEKYKIDRNIYVVADEQNHHFKQVFKVLELMGFPQAKLCDHLSYGMVVLPEGKMSSRDGNAVAFTQLRDMMLGSLKSVLAKYTDDWRQEEILTTAHRLADGALKYGMISTDPTSKIVFNLEDWLSFEGNSGPYLMYSYSRTLSILRKAAEQGWRPDPDASDALTEDSEHALLRYLFDFNNVVAAACENYKPSMLATHLFYMCKSFNRFYADVSVLKADSDTQRAARLALIQAFAATLKQGLTLLGITPPDRM